MHIAPVFAVPLGQASFPGPEKLNADLRRLFLAKEAEGAKFANPTPSLKQQPGVFESEFDLFSWPDTCVQELRKFCWKQLGLLVQEMNGYTDAELARIQIFSHTWFHVTRHGGFVLSHTHPMASWSGVYCVAPGHSPADRPDSGVLKFHNPHHYSNTFLDAGNLRPVPPYHHGTWNVRFAAGDLVIFPSWLQHEVLPFHGDDERITVAFNCWFGQRPGLNAGQ